MTNAPSPTPSRAVYGFIFHLSFKLMFIIYLIWSIIPEDWFRSIGITYLPKRYWAVIVPIYLLTVLTIFAFVIYPSLGLIMTPSINSTDTIFDSHSLKPSNVQINYNNDSNKKCCEKATTCKMKKFFKGFDNTFIEKSVPPISDLNISEVSKHLYYED